MDTNECVKEDIMYNDILIGSILSLTLYSYSRHLYDEKNLNIIEIKKMQTVLNVLSLIYGEEIRTEEGVKQILDSNEYKNIINNLGEKQKRNNDDILIGAILSLRLYSDCRLNGEKIGLSETEKEKIQNVLDYLSLLYGEEIRKSGGVNNVIKSDKFKNIMEQLQKIDKCKNQ